MFERINWLSNLKRVCLVCMALSSVEVYSLVLEIHSSVPVRELLIISFICDGSLTRRRDRINDFRCRSAEPQPLRFLASMLISRNTWSNTTTSKFYRYFDRHRACWGNRNGKEPLTVIALTTLVLGYLPLVSHLLHTPRCKFKIASDPNVLYKVIGTLDRSPCALLT